MRKSLNSLRLLNWLLLIYLITVGILVLKGRLTFGLGLGDLYYLILIGFSLLIYLPVLLKFEFQRLKKHHAKTLIVSIAAFLFLALFITYQFTYGRGAEKPWDGEILMV